MADWILAWRGRPLKNNNNKIVRRSPSLSLCSAPLSFSSLLGNPEVERHRVYSAHPFNESTTHRLLPLMCSGNIKGVDFVPLDSRPTSYHSLWL